MKRRKLAQAGENGSAPTVPATGGERFYNHPSRFRLRVYDPLIRWVLMRTRWTGFERDSLRVLAVQGRKSGNWYQHPVGVCLFDEDRYLISFYGESQWARNLRAGSGAELRKRNTTETITVTEVMAQDKVPLFEFLASRYPWIVRIWWKIKPGDMTDDVMKLLIERYPVFRLGRVDAEDLSTQD